MTASLHHGIEDVEPSDDDEAVSQRPVNEYRLKKMMSANTFKYIINANDEQLNDMQISVDDTVRACWRERITQNNSIKLDDVGDALSHALGEILCGSTDFLNNLYQLHHLCTSTEQWQ